MHGEGNRRSTRVIGLFTPCVTAARIWPLRILFYTSTSTVSVLKPRVFARLRIPLRKTPTEIPMLAATRIPSCQSCVPWWHTSERKRKSLIFSSSLASKKTFASRPKSTISARAWRKFARRFQRCVTSCCPARVTETRCIGTRARCRSSHVGHTARRDVGADQPTQHSP